MKCNLPLKCSSGVGKCCCALAWGMYVAPKQWRAEVGGEVLAPFIIWHLHRRLASNNFFYYWKTTKIHPKSKSWPRASISNLKPLSRSLLVYFKTQRFGVPTLVVNRHSSDFATELMLPSFLIGTRSLYWRPARQILTTSPLFPHNYFPLLKRKQFNLMVSTLFLNLIPSAWLRSQWY